MADTGVLARNGVVMDWSFFLNYGVLGAIVLTIGLFIWRWLLPRLDQLISATVNLITTLNARIPLQCGKLDDIKELATKTNATLERSNGNLVGIKEALVDQTTKMGQKLDLIATKQDAAATVEREKKNDA